ncbi:MAG TPA: alkaline phosphatase family protein, partial [Thermoanaerobaculia bacterium]
MIWLGLDGLDWELLDRLEVQGRMPNWKRLVSQGYGARLTAYTPILSPVIWTTLATGVGPDVHRVLDFQEVDPVTGQKVPISGRSRAVPAIWNVASAEGVSVGVVGWWGTHPAEEVEGFFVSDRASPILFEGLSRQGVAYPASLSAGVEQIASREGEVRDAELARFVDAPAEQIARDRASGEGLKNPIIALARTIAATRSQSRIARELYDRNHPDLMMLYLEGTDVVGHVFAADVPPRLACVSDADFARYGHAVDEYYALVDRLIGQWMRRAEEDRATLVVNSDHGFKWGGDRSCVRDSLNPATAGFWHRPDGVFAVWGARVRPGAERGAATVFDVAPTVSALLGLPVDRRATGSVVRAAFPDLAGPARKDLSAVPVRRL